MPHRPIESHPKDSHRHKVLQSHKLSSTHHGSPGKNGTLSASILLRVPSESLTHITSFLDPSALLAFARTNKQLYDHVNQDNTWRRAFVYQFMGISPESDLRDDKDGKTLMLRRREDSWKREFVVRYNLRRRWERSRNTTITHVPHHSTVSAMHLMPSTTILSASLHYGVVSRSYPLTGKVLRGYLDASGTLNGLGIGNPNAEFSPHVTSVALTSEGGTAKVLWGFRNGDVAVTVANRAMDNARASAAKLTRCKVEECHGGMVNHVAWGETPDGATAFVTGAADGRVKVWNAKRVKCLWTSPMGDGSVPDACLKVAIDVARGVVVGAFRSGTVMVWTGFAAALAAEDTESVLSTPHEIRLPTPDGLGPIKPRLPTTGTPEREITALHIHSAVDEQLCVLTAYVYSPYFHCQFIDLISGAVRCVAFTDGSNVPVRVLHPVFATAASEENFVLTGDPSGWVNIFALNALPSGDNQAVVPFRRFEAHEDGGVTALAWNPVVLVSGSSRGTVKVWDSLTFTPIRTFSSPAARPVVGGEWDGASQVLLEHDAFVVSVGSKVMAWKAGPVGKGDKAAGKVKKSKSSTSGSVAKWHRQVEMSRDIAESRLDLEIEQTEVRRAFGREREQRSTLNHLGLNETEAVEYVLMLSRDEEERRRQQTVTLAASSSSRTVGDDEELFFGDLDELQTPSVPPSLSFTRPPAGPSWSRASPRILPSLTNNKVEVSPRLLPEPMEAGFSPSLSGGSVSSSFGTRINSVMLPPLMNVQHFPAISPSQSSPTTSVASTPGSSLVSRPSVSGSPESYRSAWSTPLRATQSMSSVLSSPPASSPPVASHSPAVRPSLLSAEIARQLNSAPLSSAPTRPANDGTQRGSGREEEDLQFAIELSLAEARSRGDLV